MASLGAPFDYESLLVLDAVARSGSFEQAAKAMKVTQSAVSQRIRQLEERVGTVLVVRGRPCVATEDGLMLCQHLEQVMLLQHDLRRRMGSQSGAEVAPPTVRIAVNADSLATWFVHVARRAGAECNLRLEVIPDDQEHTEDRLRSGDALGAVTTSVQPVPGCSSVALGAMEYAAIASPEYVRRHFAGGVSIDSLAWTPVIGFDRKDGLPDSWMTAALGSAVEVSRHLIPSYEGHLLCALEGVGWAIMPMMTVRPMIESGALVELMPNRRIQLALNWQSHSQWSKALRDLTAIVVEVASERLLRTAKASAARQDSAGFSRAVV
jgi:LysR family transcriptional regulator, chromosome initiation inhibitor